MVKLMFMYVFMYVRTFTSICFQILLGYFRCSFDGDKGALLLLLNKAPQLLHFLQRIWHLLPHVHFFNKEAVKKIYTQCNLCMQSLSL